MSDNHERKCWDCGNIAMHTERHVPEVLCKVCGSQDTRPTAKRLVEFVPSPAEIHSACLSFRHDYGVLDEEARESLRETALEWFKVWQKIGLARQ